MQYVFGLIRAYGLDKYMHMVRHYHIAVDNVIDIILMCNGIYQYLSAGRIFQPAFPISYIKIPLL